MLQIDKDLTPCPCPILNNPNEFICLQRVAKPMRVFKKNANTNRSGRSRRCMAMASVMLLAQSCNFSCNSTVHARQQSLCGIAPDLILSFCLGFSLLTR